MIFDCFTFAGEFDALELRLDTLKDVVDKFIVAEGTRTFAGAPRDVAALHARVPACLRDRIVHLVVDDLASDPPSAWANEFKQRNALARALTEARPDDLLLLSDVDEIAHPDCLSHYRPNRFLSAVLHQRVFFYALNNELIRSADPWELPCKAARITTLGHFRRFFKTMQNLRYFGSEGRFPVAWRRFNALVLDRLLTQHLAPGGWHFTYLMKPADIARKITSFSHQEYNQPHYVDLDHLARCVQSRVDPFGRDRQFQVVALDADLPVPIQRDPARFGKWLIQDPGTH